MDRRPYFVRFRPGLLGGEDLVRPHLKPGREVSFLEPEAPSALGKQPGPREALAFTLNLREPSVAIYLDSDERDRLLGQGEVDEVELDPGCRIPTVQANVASPRKSGSDWARDLAAAAFWSNGARGQRVTVAVVDTGVSSTHEWVQIPEERRETFIGGDATTDPNGHGTHCAGIVGGRTVGVAPAVDLVSLRALDYRGVGDWGSVVAALQWCLSNRRGVTVDIVNLSLGRDRAPDEVREACHELHRAGKLVVAAAGNGAYGADVVEEPAAFRNTVAVAGLNAEWGPSSASSYGDAVEFSGPSEDMVSLGDSGQRTAVRSGTSAAAPFIAGCAALVWSACRDLTNEQVYGILAASASNDGVWTSPLGYGWPRLERAWDLLKVSPLPPTPGWRP